ncbi:ABC transporter permease [Labedaea rhizosphaerae]|uniref:Uncharacterized protein n=1 Tax=Labedaea rhizosphaerae TaxID=598644 RepID=A0A4R6SN49_LABRH|nr:ABC transporter permease [Labedaea rhizosphaerae]TDQ04802.1 hypothetical protein EV186_101760 [Labedaea rhizosphaerae]
MVGLNTPKNSTGSAYPRSVEALLPRVRDWAADLDSVPSRNRIMAEFQVGAPKARAILEALNGEAEMAPVRTLHAVPEPDTETDSESATMMQPFEPEEQVTTAADPGPAQPAKPHRVKPWPLVLLALPAFVAVWGGWVGLGSMTGFGPINLLPGIADHVVINSAITLPIGVEAYAAFALRVWLVSGEHSSKARQFAMWSAFGALVLGMAGQVAYHLMSAAGVVSAPWLVTTFVSCLPVGVLGCGAALAHLLNTDEGVQQ